MSDECFFSGQSYGTLENCISRLEITLIAYQILRDHKAVIPYPLYSSVCEDVAAVFFPPDAPDDSTKLII